MNWIINVDDYNYWNFFHSTGPIAENPQYIVGFMLKNDKSLWSILANFLKFFILLQKDRITPISPYRLKMIWKMTRDWQVI